MSVIPEQFAPYWQAIAKVREQKFERAELEHHLAESNVIIDRLGRTNAALLAVCKAYLHLLDRPAPNPEGVWDELVTRPMRIAIAQAEEHEP